MPSAVVCLFACLLACLLACLFVCLFVCFGSFNVRGQIIAICRILIDLIVTCKIIWLQLVRIASLQDYLKLETTCRHSGVNVQSILLEGYHHTLILVFAKVASLKLDEHKNVRRDYELAMQACQIAIFIGG